MCIFRKKIVSSWDCIFLNTLIFQSMFLESWNCQGSLALHYYSGELGARQLLLLQLFLMYTQNFSSKIVIHTQYASQPVRGDSSGNVHSSAPPSQLFSKLLISSIDKLHGRVHGLRNYRSAQSYLRRCVKLFANVWVPHKLETVWLKRCQLTWSSRGWHHCDSVWM